MQTPNILFVVWGTCQDNCTDLQRTDDAHELSAADRSHGEALGYR